MNREEFLNFVSMTIEEVVQFAEEKAGQKLPRKYSFQWFDRPSSRTTANIAEQIVERVFVDEDHIFTCVRLGVCDLLEDGSLLILGGFEDYPPPRPFGRNGNEREGPFVPIVGTSFLNKMVGVEDSFSPGKAFHFVSEDLSNGRTPWHIRPHIPKLPEKLRDNLGSITPSRNGDLTYWPCATHLKDGTVLTCVYVVPEVP